jgi:hypothetical protein
VGNQPTKDDIMKRKSVVILAALTLVGGTGVAYGAVGPPGINGPGLAAVGPLSPADGYPIWYQDKTGLRVESCGTWIPDPMCPAVAPRPNPALPPSFPGNFTPEGFYQLATATISTANAGRAVIATNLEESMINGQQFTFSRFRIDITNASTGVPYTVTTPAGKKTVTTTAAKPTTVFDTEDIGAAAGNFSGALAGHVGPFLTWDTFNNVPADPLLKPNALGKPTYIGDGFTPHKVIGSPYGTNFVRIESVGVNPTPLTDACPTVAGPTADCVETSLLVLQGKIATSSGVSADQATYSRSSVGAGNVDVYASSLPANQQAITTSDVPVAPALAEFAPTALTGSPASAGHYFARVPYVGAAPPTTVKVSNLGDVPVASANMPVVDQVTGTAIYTTGTPANPAAVPPVAAIPGSLAIAAVSSDTFAPPVLTASGFAALPVPLALGVLAVPLLDAPPPFVTVTSAAGGIAKLAVTVVGAAYAPIPALAQAGPAQNVAVGQLVTLDGSASVGALTFAWVSPAGIVLTNPTSANPTFTPTALNVGANVFTLTVTGAGATTSTATVTITVSAGTPAVANAGLNQIAIQRGSLVTLNGSLSSVGTYLWTQVVVAGDPIATLTGATTLSPTFTFPFYKSPANNGSLTFNLRVTSVDGSVANSLVTITPSKDTLVTTRSVYTVAKGTWLSAGTSSIIAGQTVTLHLGLVTGPVIGTAIVDPTGAFQVRGTTPPAVLGSQVTAESTLGGIAVAFPVKVQ